MRGLRIILDKSVVFGLSNLEVDSLDRYFFQVVPNILSNEILADLAKEADNPAIANRIAAYSYRVSGNRGLTVDCRKLLANSLLGIEIPMEGKYLPAGESTVRTESGSLATVIETPLEDETIARWERGDFSEQEKEWAKRWRPRMERPLNPKLYTDNIAKAGIQFTPPETDEELIATVDSLLANRKLLPRLFVILAREYGIPFASNDKITLRWSKAGRKSFEEFAPYAFFCLRANFLWNLGLTNPKLFKPDKNDRKDLEYCYYLPHAEIFSSKDNKHKRLIPALLRPYQSFVDGEELKKDLRKLSEDWDKLSREEQITLNKERHDAPPENENSVVYRLWKKLDGEIIKSYPLEMLDMKLVDSSLPEEEQVEFTLRDWVRKKFKEVDTGKKVAEGELNELRILHKGKDPTTMGVRKTKISRARALRLHPELEESDLD